MLGYKIRLSWWSFGKVKVTNKTSTEVVTILRTSACTHIHKHTYIYRYNNDGKRGCSLKNTLTVHAATVNRAVHPRPGCLMHPFLSPKIEAHDALHIPLLNCSFQLMQLGSLGEWDCHGVTFAPAAMCTQCATSNGVAAAPGFKGFSCG